MTIDINKQYQTRDGQEVKLLMTDGGWYVPGAGRLSVRP
jgi:hypothetical protein